MNVTKMIPYINLNWQKSICIFKSIVNVREKQFKEFLIFA